MNTLNAASRRIAVPDRLKSNPIDERGYLVPWFVAETAPGVYDFRVIGPDKVRKAVVGNLCWICGQRLGKYKSFVVGPMCTVNEISAEPPMHKSCAVYSVQVCPFMTQPKMVRNEKDLPEDKVLPGGHMIMRNPGVSIIWTTTSYTITRERLFHMGRAVHIEAWARGKKTIAAEVVEGIRTGVPLLEATCRDDDDRAALYQEVAAALMMWGEDPQHVEWFTQRVSDCGSLSIEALVQRAGRSAKAQGVAAG